MVLKRVNYKCHPGLVYLKEMHNKENTMSKSNRVTGVLLAAKRRIARRWAKGAWKKLRDERSRTDGYGQNSYCLEGACTGGSKIPTTPAQKKAQEYILRAIQERTHGRFRSIPQYNDHPSTTQEDVNAVVARAYELAKRDEL